MAGLRSGQVGRPSAVIADNVGAEGPLDLGYAAVLRSGRLPEGPVS